MESGHASPAETGNPTETHIPEAGEQGTGQEGGSLFHSVVFTEGQTIQESAELRLLLFSSFTQIKGMHFKFACERTLNYLLPVLKIDVDFTLEFLIY